MTDVPHAKNVYVLPAQARLDLIQLRDHLHFMRQLTEPAPGRAPVEAIPHEHPMRADAMAWWFSHLARDLGRILEAASGPHPAAGMAPSAGQ